MTRLDSYTNSRLLSTLIVATPAAALPASAKTSAMIETTIAGDGFRPLSLSMITPCLGSRARVDRGALRGREPPVPGTHLEHMRVAAVDQCQGTVGADEGHRGTPDDDRRGALDSNRPFERKGLDLFEGDQSPANRIEERRALVQRSACHIDNLKIRAEQLLKGWDVALEQCAKEALVGQPNGLHPGLGPHEGCERAH